MLPTRPYSSLKGMLPKIHHPLPLNEKSRKKLLDTLTTSFRKHLDREHGLGDEHAESSVAAATKTVTQSSTKSADAATAATPIGTPSSSPRHRPTDRHLRAILSNPLFTYDQLASRPNLRSSVTKAVPAAAANAPGILTAAPLSSALAHPSTTHAETAQRDPMDIFDWAVARGLMTTKRAAGCLLAKRREAVQSSHALAKTFMADTGAGLRVLQWLRASGLERDLSFVADTQFTSVLVQFLAAEPAMEAVVWQWIARLQQNQDGQDGPAQVEVRARNAPAYRVGSAAFVLDALVKAKAGGADTLDDAYRTMSQAAADLPADLPAATATVQNTIVWPWFELSWLSTLKAWNLADPSPALYDGFARIMDSDPRPSVLIERAHLDLRHPTKPSPAPAQALLDNDTLLTSVLRHRMPAEPPTGRRPAHAARIVSMGLDTVRHLAFVGQSDEAQRILHRLQRKFGENIEQRQVRAWGTLAT
ncbi:hypothetical protein SPBR_04246 [Sporothrix brasiliensis 5110]|uniref:Uncharacterized protein n=1 Tax=Sporothrix brasiliensis 5110 TaxID=1398154 RepID=A0A0C2J9T6_9PEZI|nr:uncharacterized protein SPBR_04246 [Sporothrix brasiliensis 5110]KIH93657.1 hypothetical protein SPBR_04246 [Sporothrix brasiliensis 5110]